MKETIYTIPVTEALQENENGDCPFCIMYRKLNENSIEFVMGPSYMEDDVRMETNKIGFCSRHLTEMYQRPNRLGLALMMHTHLMQINKDLASSMKKMGPASKGILGIGKKQNTSINEACSYLKKLEHSCYICNRVDNTFIRYIDTYFYLWGRDKDMKELTANSSGFCLNHFYLLLETGEKKLSAGEFANFLEIITPIQEKSLKTLEDDLDWFIRKFDYRNVNEPWKNSKDALIRALRKISSVVVIDK